jgi:primosomal protein N' (replication factor Y)
MYIVTVIPIKKGIQGEYLSYFYSENLTPGTMVLIPIRSKEENAIVIDSEEVLSLKSEIKNKDYQLKKIIRVKGETPFSKDFFIACQITKKYFVSNTGVIIKSLLPSLFLDKIDKLNKIPEQTSGDIVTTNEKFIFQTNEKDRLAFYRTLIRESFAKKESVFICVPTKYDINLFYKELSKGIESFTFSFHLELSSKKIIENYNSVASKDHPVLIIGTGMFLSVARQDTKTIIIEKESSEAYKQLSRPYVDIRSFAEILSSIKNIKLIFGDTLLRPETLNRYDQGELYEIAPPSYRLFKTDNLEIVDMSNKEESKNKFQIISKEIIEMITESFKKNESVFLFTLRKGLAPMTVCNDCKHVLLCPSCSTPIVLYGPKQDKENKEDRSRIFMCNKCGRKERTEVSCPTCNSWNLVPLGVGIDKVALELKTLFPNTKIFQIDKENTRTPKEAREEIDSFNKNPQSILLGTEMAFSFIEENIYASGVISLDGLFSIPSFNMGQKIIHLFEKLVSITENKIIIQTRIPDNKILQSIMSGNVLSYLREDINERKRFGYPPFKRLIKITFEGSSSDTEKTRNFLEKNLALYDPQIFSAFVSKVRGNYITNTVLKVDIQNWPLIEKGGSKIINDLYQSLQGLPPSFSINVDPEDLL